MKASAASANDWAMAKTCTPISSLRLSDRSAMSPAQAPSSSTGPNWQAVSRPTASPLPVIFRTSSVWAIIVSQLPTWEMSWPLKKRRKLRTPREEKVSRVTERRCFIGSSRSDGWRAARKQAER